MLGRFVVLVFVVLVFDVFAINIDKYEKAALKGNVKAMVTLGKVYYAGKEVPQDYKKSFFYFSKAVSEGDTQAKIMLSALYQKGIGTKRNILMVMKLLKEASDDGDKLAKEWLESLGDLDVIIKKDIKKKLKSTPQKSKILGIVLGEPFRNEMMNLEYNAHSNNDRLRKVFMEVSPLYANADTSNIENITVFTSVLSNTVYEAHVEYKSDVKNYLKKFVGKKTKQTKTKLMPFEYEDKVSYVDFDVVNSPFKKDAFFRVTDINNLEGIRHIVSYNRVVVIDFSALALATMEAIENNKYFNYIGKNTAIDKRYRSIFGLSLMDTLDDSLNPKDVSNDSRWDWYSVKPPKPNPLFSKHLVKTTFFTKRIYDISASGKVSGIGGDERCRKAVDKLLKNFTDTFSNANSKQLYNNLKSQKFANFNIDKNGVTKKSPHSFGSKVIDVGLSCSANSHGEWFINLSMKSFYGEEISEIENCLLSHNSNIWESLNCKILLESYRR